MCILVQYMDLPGGSDGKASFFNVGYLGLIPGWERFLGEGNGNSLQYSCLENPMDGGAWCRLLSMGSQRVRHDWARLFSSKINHSFVPYFLEEGMPVHSSILVWRIPWIEEPGGLQSMGSQRVGHNWATELNWVPFSSFINSN